MVDRDHLDIGCLESIEKRVASQSDGNAGLVQRAVVEFDQCFAIGLDLSCADKTFIDRTRELEVRNLLVRWGLAKGDLPEQQRQQHPGTNNEDLTVVELRL